MSDTPFKTPFQPRFTSEESDSAESTTSEGSINDLTVVALYDDLIRLMRSRRENEVEDAFMHYLGEFKMLFMKYSDLYNEHQRVCNVLDAKVQECSETERRMYTARRILDEQKRKNHRLALEKEELELQLDQVRELLLKDNKVNITEDAKRQLSFLNKKSCHNNGGLSRIQEINSTGSMLSDFSVSRSEDDLDTSYVTVGREWKKHRPSTEVVMDPPSKKLRSSNKFVDIGLTDTVRATTTVTVNKKGPITATSVIESIPQPNGALSSDDGVDSTAPRAFERNGTPKRKACNNDVRPELRQHSLQHKSVIVTETCICCEKKIRFGKSALKCKECRSTCHHECADQLPMPCVPSVNTPNKNMPGKIGDYASTIPPMVPALIVHCVNEIELRGLNELGLYRISASEREVKSLKEKFLKGRGSPSIAQTDIHVLCACVKDFLRGLSEPLVTVALWHDFARAVEARDAQDVVPAIYQCISQLPRPNRDTLAYIVLHLQKYVGLHLIKRQRKERKHKIDATVWYIKMAAFLYDFSSGVSVRDNFTKHKERIAESPACKMPIENLAKVFGPPIVGFVSESHNLDSMLTETRQQIAVVEQLIRLPSDYWSNFVNVPTQQPTAALQQTPSASSLSSGRRFYRTPKSKSVKKRFNTPPAFKKPY